MGINKAKTFSCLLLRLFIFLIFINTFCKTLNAQQLSSFKHFTFLSDFPQNTVQTIYQDFNGYIWAGTLSGLNRYDGKRIVNYKIGFNDNFTLNGKFINSITEDDRHNLWIATDNGLTIFSPNGTPEKNKQLSVIADKINKSTTSKYLECIKILSTGKVMLGFGNEICIYDLFTGNIKTFSSVNQGLGNTFAVKFEEDRDKNIVAITNTKGIYKLDTGLQILKHIEQKTFGQKGEFILFSSLYLPGDKLYIGSSQGLYKLDLKTNTPPQKIKDQQGILLSTLRFNCLAYDTKKNVILGGTGSAGIITFDTSGIVLDQLADKKNDKKLQSNNIFYILADKRGLGYWIGNGKGLIKFFYDEDRFTSHPILDNELNPFRIYPIYTENNNDILIGTERFLIKYNLKTKEKQQIRTENNKEVRYHFIHKINKNFYLFCTQHGLFYSENISNIKLNKISSKYPELIFLDTSNILCALKINEDELLIGTRGIYENGLVRWNTKKRTADRFVTNAKDSTSISGNIINAITLSHKGEIIVCTNKGICYFNNNTSKFRRVLAPGANGINYPQVNSVLAEQGILWIGTYGGGLNKYTYSTGKLEYITEKEGLASNDIYDMYRGGPDQLWMSTNSGITLYNTTTGKIRNFDKADGIINNEFNRTSSFKYGDTLYFGGISGITYFNYRNIQQNLLKPIADISRVILLKGGSEEPVYPDSVNQLTLSHSENTLKFYFASPYYINPGKTVFLYRLLPNQQEWINNGTNDELIITQVPPGKHTLQIKTINSEGIESGNIKSTHINITPPWYQTNWFRILLIITIISIGYGFYMLRINQFKREERIRNQLAADLHDDLGSTLNSVKVYSNLALIEKENPNHLLKLKESTQDAIAGVRELIWILDDKKDTIQDLFAKITQFAAPLCEANHIRFIKKIDEVLYDYKLQKNEKRSLYMICKESINNSIKYASCGLIELKAETEGKKIIFSIRDDGKGCEIEQLKDGNGLKNIMSRAKAIGYKSNLISSEGNGTIIILQKV